MKNLFIGAIKSSFFVVLSLALFQLVAGFSPVHRPTTYGASTPLCVSGSNPRTSTNCCHGTTTRLHLFNRVFEEEGPLGKGITVGKVQVALISEDRGEDSIFGALENNARWVEGDDAAGSLADLAHEVCLSLLRKKDSWTAAHSESMWFGAKDAGKAEQKYNEWANSEAAKFEKEYVQEGTNTGGATQVVVSLVIEIEGDSTKFKGAGFSMSGTQEVLNSIASNCIVDEGEVTNAVEVFWTPGDPKETLSSTEMIIDFPELVTL